MANKGVNLGFSVSRSIVVSESNFLTNQSLFDFSIEEYSLVYDAPRRDYNTSARQLEYKHCNFDSFDYSREVLEAFNIEILY